MVSRLARSGQLRPTSPGPAAASTVDGKAGGARLKFFTSVQVYSNDARPPCRWPRWQTGGDHGGLGQRGKPSAWESVGAECEQKGMSCSDIDASVLDVDEETGKDWPAEGERAPQ